jgi:hypothetical protein
MHVTRFFKEFLLTYRQVQIYTASALFVKISIRVNLQKLLCAYRVGVLREITNSFNILALNTR